MRRRPSAWDDELWTDGPWPSQTSPRDGGGGPDGTPRASLWLPDPESFHGWSVRHVWPEKEPPPKRGMGFNRRE